MRPRCNSDEPVIQDVLLDANDGLDRVVVGVIHGVLSVVLRWISRPTIKQA